MGIEQVYKKGGLVTECMCVFDGMMCQNVPNEVDIYTLLLTTSTNKRECPYTIIPEIYMASTSSSSRHALVYLRTH